MYYVRTDTSLAVHMYVWSSKLRDVVRVRVIVIDSSNSLPDHAMFGRLEDDSWFMRRMRQFTLAEHTLAGLCGDVKPDSTADTLWVLHETK